VAECVKKISLGKKRHTEIHYDDREPGDQCHWHTQCTAEHWEMTVEC
jgi:hypothetical protein